MLTKIVSITRLSCFLTVGIFGCAHACPIGFMQVSKSTGPFSCQKTGIVLAAPVPILSNNACPDGSFDSRNIGALDACHKSVNGEDEVVLRVGEHCPTGDVLFVDIDGNRACKLPAKIGDAADAELTGF